MKRRQTITVAVGAAAGLAGCSGFQSEPSGFNPTRVRLKQEIINRLQSFCRRFNPTRVRLKPPTPTWRTAT